MQWEETSSLPWFWAPTTCDTYSFNHLGSDATHYVAPDFKPICLANFRQWGSLNAHKFAHTVQGRKIPEMLFSVSSLFSPQTHPCFHKVAFNCWLWTRTITGYKNQSCFNKRAQGWLERSISQRNVCCTKDSTWCSVRVWPSGDEVCFSFFKMRWDGTCCIIQLEGMAWLEATHKVCLLRWDYMVSQKFPSLTKACHFTHRHHPCHILLPPT